MIEPGNNRPFHTTRWSVIASARDADDDSKRRDALTELYSTYWYPLFAYLRRKGYSAVDSGDYLQSFFVELMEKNFLKAVEPDKGRFRWFMMSALSRFVANQLAHQNAAKRGGNVNQFSIDLDDAEQRYGLEPVDNWTPEKLFDRQWALEVLRGAIVELHSEYESKSKGRLFELLQHSLNGSELEQKTYLEIADELGMTEGAVKVSAFRLRSRFRELLEQSVAHTVRSKDEVESELEFLLESLRGE